MLAIGLMSGTSLDGVDAVLCEIHSSGKSTKIKVIDFQTYPIPEEIYHEVKRVCLNDDVTTQMICSLNFKMGTLFSSAVSQLCEKNKINSKNIGFVASHGQTLHHQPIAEKAFVASTMQIGEPAIIAYENDVDVISDFRVMDIVAGGEGAPLVPYSEMILYHEDGKNIALQNIGGIGNVTFLSGDGDQDKLFAFDTGPGNMIIDEGMKCLYQKAYDQNGDTAATGIVDETLLSNMMDHEYFQLKPPKSTGREMFGEAYVKQLLHQVNELRKEDIIATFTMFTAKTIVKSYEDFILSNHHLDKMIIGGGGAHNKILIQYIKRLLPSVEVLTQEDVGYSSDAKEAIAFVVLGNETCYGHASNVKQATGAKKQVVLGKITPKPIGSVSCLIVK